MGKEEEEEGVGKIGGGGERGAPASLPLTVALWRAGMAWAALWTGAGDKNRPRFYWTRPRVGSLEDGVSAPPHFVPATPRRAGGREQKGRRKGEGRKGGEEGSR